MFYLSVSYVDREFYLVSHTDPKKVVIVKPVTTYTPYEIKRIVFHAFIFINKYGKYFECFLYQMY